LDAADASGATSIRKNMVQVDAAGTRMSSRRPDASYVLQDTRQNTNYLSDFNFTSVTELNRELAAFKALMKADPNAVNVLVLRY
jgi:hypothetical protein